MNSRKQPPDMALGLGQKSSLAEDGDNEEEMDELMDEDGLSHRTRHLPSPAHPTGTGSKRAPGPLPSTSLASSRGPGGLIPKDTQMGAYSLEKEEPRRGRSESPVRPPFVPASIGSRDDESQQETGNPHGEQEQTHPSQQLDEPEEDEIDKLSQEEVEQQFHALQEFVIQISNVCFLLQQCLLVSSREIRHGTHFGFNKNR
jgi:hypothetical protein